MTDDELHHHDTWMITPSSHATSLHAHFTMLPDFVSLSLRTTTVALLAAAGPHGVHREIGARGRSVAACPASVPAPTPARDLEPLSLHYAGTFTAGDRTMAITSTVVVTAHLAGGWAVVERAALPRGVAIDSTRLATRTLVSVERITTQGPMQITLHFADSTVTGEVSMAGQTRPIAAELCGPMVGDGAGAFLVIGRLPLGPAYRTILRHLDVRSATVTMRQLVVLDSEPTTVPAGRFETWKVEVSDDGHANPTTIWIDRTSSVPVRFSASQGPVTITMDLVGHDPRHDARDRRRVRRRHREKRGHLHAAPN